MIHALQSFKHWLLYGDIYQFTSGPVLIFALLHRHNCHEPWCPFIVRHGQTHCKRHRHAS